MLKEKEYNFALLQRLADVIFISLSWWIAYYIRFEMIPGAQSGLSFLFLKLNAILVLILLWVFQNNNLYSSYRFSSRSKEIFKVLKSTFLTSIYFVLVIYFFAENRVSRITLVLFFLTASIVLTLARIIVRNALRTIRSKGLNLRFVTVVGDSELLGNYVDNVRKYKDCGIKIKSWIDSSGMNKKYNVESSESLNDKPDFYVVSYSDKNKVKEQQFLKEHYNDVTPIQLLPDLSYSLVGHEIEDFAGIPLLTVNQPVFSNTDLFLKRLVDTVIVGIGMLIISPLLLLLMILVKLTSPGPIFYGQERITKDGKKFKMWKFRSMKVAVAGEDQTTWGSKDNPRITRFGNFIRKTSLDELPQLWNVLVGEMSLVGPRPERTHFVNQFKHEIPHYMLRHKMKAGITGWAQVNGLRGDTDLVKRIEFDIYYIKNWSILFDIKIIFLTFLKGFLNKNAY